MSLLDECCNLITFSVCRQPILYTKIGPCRAVTRRGVSAKEGVARINRSHLANQAAGGETVLLRCCQVCQNLVPSSHLSRVFPVPSCLPRHTYPQGALSSRSSPISGIRTALHTEHVGISEKAPVVSAPHCLQLLPSPSPLRCRLGSVAVLLYSTDVRVIVCT